VIVVFYVLLGFVTLAAVIFALLPLRSSATALRLKTERDELQDELDAALHQIRDLERSHADGEIDAAEFERLKLLDETRAAKLLATLEATPEDQAVPTPATAKPVFSRALLGLIVTGVALGSLSAFAVPGLQRLALREGEAKLYDESNKLLALEQQLNAQAAAKGQAEVKTLEAFGDLAWELQDWERAAQAYGSLLRIERDNINAVSRYGQLLFFAGQNDQALTLLRAAAKFDNAEALLTIGNILFSAKNDPKGALEVWERYQVVTKGKGEARVAELINAAKKRLGTTDPGAQVFAQSCAGCHGASGQGISGTAPNLLISKNARDAAFVKRQVQRGSQNGQMPAFPQITGKQLEDLVKYVNALKP
jgi:cytochrome c-type biogenesis protein CcmI